MKKQKKCISTMCHIKKEKDKNVLILSDPYYFNYFTDRFFFFLYLLDATYLFFTFREIPNRETPTTTTTKIKKKKFFCSFPR